MADKGEHDKPTEQVPKTVNVPDIEITEEGAVGGAEDKCAKEGIFSSFARKVKNIGHGKRSKSVSPESRKTRMESGGPKEGSKVSKSLSTSRNDLGVFDAFRSVFQKGRKDDEERKNLCEQEFTDQAKPHLAPPEKDMGIASPSPPSEPMAEKCDTYNKSSSVSSAPSDYSSLPDDYDTDVMSPDDPTFPEDGKQKLK